MNPKYLSPLLLLAFSLMGRSLYAQTTELSTEIKVLQFNIWQEGTVVEGGFEAVADEIVRSDADFVTLSEVRNYHDTRFCDRIVQALAERGATYFSFYSEDTGLLSRHPIEDSCVVYPLANDQGSIHRMVTEVGGRAFAVYTAHLDYRHCALYDIRGYDGSTWEPRIPVTNLDSVLFLNALSHRDDAIAAFIAFAEKDLEEGRIVIIGGDFNEPSHLDWTASTKDLRGHAGLVVPWQVSVMLSEAGYVDAYRQLYPDPLSHPGFTCTCNCPDTDLSKLVWAPEADDRERIDYIMYAPTEDFTLREISLIGPTGDILFGQRHVEETSDPIIPPVGIWPTDHKALLATFSLSR